MNYRFAQLIQTPKISKTIADIYIAQPDARKEKLAGRLFVLIEINSNNVNNVKIINFLIDTIVQNFYQNEKLYLREKIPSLTLEHIFETGLAKTNKYFLDFLHKEKITIDWNDINITVGLIFNNEIYLATNGKNIAFLIYPKADNIKEYAIMTALRPTKKSDNPKQQRLFSNVISGHIPNKASFFLSNETLPEYISTKQLINIISTLPPANAIEQIKNTLSDINAYVSFLGIIIKNTKIEIFSNQQNQVTQSASRSVESLNKTETATESLLTPSGMINIKKWIKLLFSRNQLPAINKQNKQTLFLKDKIFVKKRSITKKIKNIVLKTSALILKIIIYFYHNIKNKKLFKKLPTNLNFIKLLFIKLKQKKFLLGLSLIFILAFLAGLYSTNKQQHLSADKKKYNEIIKTIEQKQNQVEANLLYSNDEGAKKLFDEINYLLAELPQNDEEQQVNYQKFKNKFDKQLEKIRRITKLNSAEKIADFRELNSQAQVKNIVLLKNTGQIYADDPQHKSIYVLDLLDKMTTTITELEQSINNLHSPTLINNQKHTIIYYLNNNNIVSLNTKENSFKTFNLPLATTDHISGLASYNNKLYLLDNTQNNIYRYQKNEQTMGQPRAWLQDNSKLSQAIDIAIDGHIYILNQDSSVWQMLNGHKTNFHLENCDPPLSHATKIKTTQDSDYLYILEPDTNRLLVYDKTGQFVMQYLEDRLNNLTDFAINQTEKIIYFLSNNQIYKYPAIHLK